MYMGWSGVKKQANRQDIEVKHQLNYLRIVIYLRSSAPITNEDRTEIEFNDIKEMNRQLECYREYLNLTLNKTLI